MEKFQGIFLFLGLPELGLKSEIRYGGQQHEDEDEEKWCTDCSGWKRQQWCCCNACSVKKAASSSREKCGCICSVRFFFPSLNLPCFLTCVRVSVCVCVCVCVFSRVSLDCVLLLEAIYATLTD